MTDYIYIAEKREGSREPRRVAHLDKAMAQSWLETQIEHDPMMDDDFEWCEYRKLVAEGDEDEGYVYGTIESIPWVESTDDPLVDLVSSDTDSVSA